MPPPTLSPDNQLQIQRQSYGIKPDLDAAGWHVCYFSDIDINARDEEYYFPCSNDKQCCGRECCTPVAGGFPLWLALLIGILVFLLLLLLTLCAIYYCWKYCCRKKQAPAKPSPRPTPVVVHRELTPAPTPGVQTYRRVYSANTLRRESDSNLTEMKETDANNTPSTNTMTTVVSLNSSNRSSSRDSPILANRRPRRTRSQRRRNRDWSHDDMHDDFYFSEPKFVPSPMHESYESSPTPIRISYHEEAEFKERRPLLTRVQTPDEQKARTVFYRPFDDQVASYNEQPK